MVCEPGEELQVDFGQGAWIADPGGRRRRPPLFRAGLRYSRRAYGEVAWRQDTEMFICGLENVFRHFGGVTATLVPDNLKAAVLRSGRERRTGNASRPQRRKAPATRLAAAGRRKSRVVQRFPNTGQISFE